MNLVSLFNSIRDIPYKIPLKWEEEDNCCSGKHEKLFNLLTKNGCNVRYRVCIFLWSSLNFPPELEKIPHSGECTHTYLEIKIGGIWKILDATWDSKLKDIFNVNEWDGKSVTGIAVKPIQIFTSKKSLEIVSNNSKQDMEKDLQINGQFYKAFNDWIERIRQKS